MCCGKLRGLPFGGQHDNEYVLRGMMWADNCWSSSDNREMMICMVNDIIEELLDVDMEPKPESLWWISTHKHEDMRTLLVGGRDRVCCFFVKSWMCWGSVFHRDGKGFQGTERTMSGGVISTSIAQIHSR